MKESNVFLIGSRGMEKLEKVTLPLYAEIFFSGYGDHKAAIFKIDDSGTHWAVSMQEEPRIYALSYPRPLSKKFGIGSYYYDDLRTVPAEEVLPYVEKAQGIQSARQALQIEQSQNRKAKEEAGKVIFEAARPKDAKAVIVAELREDESDTQSDYYGHSTKRVIILAFSSHARDIFSEMRKACLNCDIEEVRKFAEAPVKPADGDEFWTAPDEHREKYSMGGGYYLGASRNSGWVIRKDKFYGDFASLYVAAGTPGNFFADKAPATTTSTPKATAAPADVPTGKIQIIDYSERAIAVVGDTKPLREKLKELGGKWNRFLTCGPGWIFSKNKLEAVKAALTAGKDGLI